MAMLNGNTGFITPLEVFDAAWGRPAKSLPDNSDPIRERWEQPKIEI
jgi:hypothetical protein